MRHILFGRNLILLLCFLVASGCAATKTTTKPATASPTPKPVIHPESRPEPLPKNLPEILYVTYDQVNLRGCPSLKCKATVVLKSGDEVIKLGQEEDWINVKVKATHREGWVASHLVGKMPPKKKTSSRIKEATSPSKKDKQGSSELQEEFSP